MKFPGTSNTTPTTSAPNEPVAEPVAVTPGWKRWHRTPVAEAAAPERERIVYRERRSGGVLWALAAGVVITVGAVVLINMNDPRSIGTQLDDTISSVRNVGTEAGTTLAATQEVAAQASRDAVHGVAAAIDDTGISAKVKAALAVDPALKASRIIVNTDRGVVRLDGPAPDAAAKERATVLASAPAGVVGVDNRLTLPQGGNVVPVPTNGQPVSVAPAAIPVAAAVQPVVLTPVSATDDAAVTASVKAALAADAVLSTARIDVATTTGVVRIEGVVPDAAARDRAALLATGQRGVRAVDNRLALASEGMPIAQAAPVPIEPVR